MADTGAQIIASAAGGAEFAAVAVAVGVLVWECGTVNVLCQDL